MNAPEPGLTAEPLAEAWPRPPGAPAPVGVRPELVRAVTRWFFGSTALVSLLAVGLVAASRSTGTGSAWVVLGWGLLAIAAALSMRIGPRRLAAGMTIAMVAASLLVAAGAVSTSIGAASPGLGAYGALVCVLCAGAGWRPGLLLAAVDAALLLLVHALVPVQPARDVAQLLGTQMLSLAVGLTAGLMVAHVLSRYLRSAAEREQRFASLLALAADAYWEIDQQYHLSAAVYQLGGEQRVAEAFGRDDGLGRPPWELPRFGCDPEVLDSLLADLDARQAFREVPVRWTTSDDELRHYLVSGEPRFDERGVFKGYWGVARDISAETRARETLAATETRYRELFSRIPTAIVLHRGGRAIDANPAALELFGFEELDGLRAIDLLSTYESGDSRERARRRMEQLQGQPLGTALPITDFRLRVGERRITVRATGVCVDAAGGPAVLSIFLDDTERRTAEEMVRRSEALLSHLVATSPDLITLTELESGRYAMVNHAFERISGWSAAEAVGKTSLELQVWHSDAQREQFVTAIRERGQVANLPMSFRARDGSTFSLLVSAARFTMDQRDYVVINARDVTGSERERLEREAILANASVGIAVTRERRFVLANRHFEALFGWPSGELLGQGGRVVWAGDDDYLRIGREVGPALGRGETVEFETPMARRDGRTLLARVRAHAIDPVRPAEGGTVWIVDDITQRREAELALARARDEAEAANRAKSAFLANTSHELRTPLNGMIGLTHLAREPGLDEAVRARYLGQIADSAQALAGIISDILDLSKIEAGKLQIEATTFDPAELFDGLSQVWAPQAQARGLVFQAEIGPDVAGPARGDPLRVRQIAANFLSNAVKFTERGQVQLRVGRLAGGAVLQLEVQDSGPGIDAPTLARLFKPFTQADQSTTRRFGGSGLGLSICRELAGLMGGEVGVESRLGEGSRFWARLPLPATDALPAPPTAEGERSLAGVRVLLVEDNPVNMLIAASMLERWGVQVAQAGDGQAAVAAVGRAAAEGQPYDLVLMDVQMPVMSGHEATRALRAAGYRLPVVALTAAALVTEREAAIAAGMDDFLTKPIDVDKLRATLLRWHQPADVAH